MGLFGPSKERCYLCGKTKTRRRDDRDRPICPDCDIKRALNAEEVIECPLDAALMAKEQVVDTELIIDRCPKCGGVWLERGELDKLRKIMEEEFDDDDDVSNSFGAAFGMVFGR